MVALHHFSGSVLDKLLADLGTEFAVLAFLQFVNSMPVDRAQPIGPLPACLAIGVGNDCFPSIITESGHCPHDAVFRRHLLADEFLVPGVLVHGNGIQFLEHGRINDVAVVVDGLAVDGVPPLGLTETLQDSFRSGQIVNRFHYRRLERGRRFRRRFASLARTGRNLGQLLQCGIRRRDIVGTDCRLGILKVFLLPGVGMPTVKGPAKCIGPVDRLACGIHGEVLGHSQSHQRGPLIGRQQSLVLLKPQPRPLLLVFGA